MAERRNYDAIVVGGGSVGVPCALSLAQRGLSVLVVEKRHAVGQGENKAAIGGVRATHSDPAKIVLCLRTLDAVTHWKERHGDEIGWQPGGYCFPAYDERTETTLKGLLPKQRLYGLVNDWIEPDAVDELVPGINRDGLRGGTWSPFDGQVSSILLPVVLMRHAQRHGAEFVYDDEVTGYERGPGGAVVGVTTRRGATYCAPRVILAAGGDAAAQGRLLGLDIPVVPDLHEAGISAPMERFIRPLVVDLRPGPEGRTLNFYFGQNHEGQVIFCYTPKEPILGENRMNTSEFLPVLAARMIALVPRLRHMLVRRTWRGCYPATPDGCIILDNVAQVPGLTLAVGMCGQGFMLGIGVGDEVASLAVDGVSTLPPEAAQAIRFDRDFHRARAEALK